MAMTAAAPNASEVVPSIAGAAWRAYLPIALVTVLGIVITWAAFREVTDWERQRIQDVFLDAARDRVLVVKRAIENDLAVVEDIGSLFDASRWVGRRDFRKFVDPALERHPSIQALEWVPRVAAADRPDFETEARRSFRRFRITERAPDASLVKAGHRAEHFPVLYVQPYQLNKPRLGFDLASDPSTLADLVRTREAGQLLVSLAEAAGEEGATAFVARLPVYFKDEAAEWRGPEGEEEPLETASERHPELRGFAQGRFRLGDVVERALESLSPAGIDVVLYDVTDEDGKLLLYAHVSRLPPVRTTTQDGAGEGSDATMRLTQTLDITDRQWEVVCTAVPGRYQADPWSGWVVLAGGLAFTALLTVYLASLVGRAAQVRRMVAQRTWQLVNANAALNRQVTERKRAEQELQALNETLEQRVARRTAEAGRRAEELEQFAYVASHDLKAPLRAIANLAGWIQEDLEDKLTDDTRESLKLLNDRVRRMQMLIQGLLEYSRVGRTEGSREDVDTGRLVAEVVDSLAPPPGFSVDISPGMPTVHTDRLQLGQVLANLIGNSLKHHGGDTGHVWVSAQDQGSYVQFSVADDGVGIAPEYQDKVFLMFQTLEAKDYDADTGIGLALVKKIVQERGGSITLASAHEKGATFYFTWPKDG